MKRKDLTFEEYQQLVETQSQALVSFISSIAAGNLEADWNVPEGEMEQPEAIKPLAKVGEALRVWVGSWQELISVQQEARRELEERLAERNHELEKTIKELQAVQRRYLHHEWNRYAKNADVVHGYLLAEETDEPTSSAWLPVMTTAVQQVKTASETGDPGETTLALPIRLHGEVIGVLGFAREGETGTSPRSTPRRGVKGESWTAEEIAVVEAVVEQVGSVLEGRRLFDQTQVALATAEHQARRLAQLNEMSQQFSQAREADEQEIFKIAARHILQIIPADQISLALLNDKGDTITSLVLHGDVGDSSGETPGTSPLERPRRGKGKSLIIGTAIEAAIRENRIIITSDAQAGEWQSWSEQLEHGIRSSIHLPLMVGPEVIGALNIGRKEPNTYSQQDEGVMVQIASLLSAAIENRRLLAEGRRLATIVENHPDFIGIGTLDGKAIYVNPAGLKLMGLPANHNVTTMEIGDFYPPVEAKIVAQEGIPTALEKGSWSSQANLLRVDSATVPVEQTIGINYDANRTPVSFSLTMRDMHKSQAAEVALAKRAVELETVAQVSTAVSTILELDKLLQTVVDLTKERFNLYHAHIYLLDEAGDTLNLAAGAGEVGRQMVAEGWGISLAQERSLVARAARNREGVIVNDVRQEPGFLPNRLLPDTRSEMAAPLLVAGQLLGVLDVQAREVNRFTTEDVRIQTTLAAQIAVAVQNARLYAQARHRAEREQLINNLTQQIQTTTTIERALQITIRALGKAFQAYRTQVTLTATGSGYMYDLKRVSPLPPGSGLVELGEATMIQPLLARGETLTGSSTIGYLALKEPQVLIEEASEIMQAAADRLSAQLENLRLIEQTQAALTEAETLYNLSAKLNATATLDEILQVVISRAVERGANYANLFTIDLDPAGHPEWVELRATWVQQEQVLLPPGARLQPVDLPGSHLWLDDPYDPVMVGDIFQDERLNLAAQQIYRQVGAQAVVMLPLAVGRNWVGVINIYWPGPQVFTARDMRFYRSLAAQAAVLVNNRLLFSQTQETLARAEATQRRYTIQAWESYRAKETPLRHEQVRPGVKPLADPLWGRSSDLPPAVAQAVMSRQTTMVTTPLNKAKALDSGNADSDNKAKALDSDTEDSGDKASKTKQLKTEPAKSSLIVPLTVRDEVIGVLGLEDWNVPAGTSPLERPRWNVPEGGRGKGEGGTKMAQLWSPEEIAFVEAVVAQMAEAAETLRLLDETQRRAAREARANEIGERIQAAQSLEEALRIAVKEVGLSLQAPQTTVQLNIK